MTAKILTQEEYSNIIERIQFYQNKIERLERESIEKNSIIQSAYHILDNKTERKRELLKRIEDLNI